MHSSERVIRGGGREARGTVAAIASKSDLHRLLIAAALGDRPCEIPLSEAPSEDIYATVECLNALGAEIAIEKERIHVIPINQSGETPRSVVLKCRESGSTLRFLLPVAAALGREAVFTGEGRLPQRPLRPLLERLSGIEIQEAGFGEADQFLRIHGQLRAGEFRLPGNVSSQYLTGLLFALPLLEGDSRLSITSPLESAGYVRMTLRTLQQFGVTIQESGGGWHVPGKQVYQTPGSVLKPEGDWSNAAFWLAAGALAGDITVTGLSPDSEQPDKAIINLLEQMGAKLNGQLSARKASLRGMRFDASGAPDLVPVMAVLMALAEGESRVVNAARLRLKESDRLAVMADNLNALGARVTEQPEGLVIHGVPSLRGGEVTAPNDHRVAMAMAVAALRCTGTVTLRGADTVKKSYPDFWQHYAKLVKEP
ncbi:MAG: 3-phosphoshikimate 1-carboxyvinyltransferase [Oscillospiraceae bacterium]|nr:3-phosphoshikimate 1-carboxyvinyltransferase [Oscillospiraceae bacterium]